MDMMMGPYLVAMLNDNPQGAAELHAYLTNLANAVAGRALSGECQHVEREIGKAQLLRQIVKELKVGPVLELRVPVESMMRTEPVLMRRTRDIDY